MTWASPPGATEVVEDAATESEPVSTPRTMDQPTAMEAKLIGTAVVEGGPSFAVLQLATGIRFVQEGDEIGDGLRLVKVMRNRIDIERKVGGHQEIRMGSSGAVRQEVSPGSISGEVTEADVQGLLEYRRQKVYDLMEWVARHRG